MEVNKVLEAQIDDLLGDLQTPAPIETPIVESKVEPIVVEPKVEPKVEPIIESKIESIVEPKIEPKVEPIIVVEPKVESIVIPPKDPKDTEIEAMRSTIEELRRTIETVASQASAPRPAVEPVVPIAPVVTKFIEKEEDLDKILNSVDNFNTFLSDVLSKNNEQASKNIPDLSSTIDRIVTQKLAVNEFYANNRDLSGNKAYVGMVANELSVKNPTWTLEDVIKELATEVRNKLRMSGIIPAQAPGTPPIPLVVDTPAFVPGGGTRPAGGGTPMSKLEAGIADLLEGANV